MFSWYLPLLQFGKADQHYIVEKEERNTFSLMAELTNNGRKKIVSGSVKTVLP